MLYTLVKITDREKEILEHVVGGDSNKVIAYKLGIEPSTVRNHMANMMKKLDALNRTHTVVKAVRLGIIQL